MPTRPHLPRSTDRLRRHPRLAQAAAATAVLVGVAGAWSAVNDPFAQTTVRRGPALIDASNAGRSSASSYSAPQDPAAVPSDFALWSLTPKVGGSLYGLGQGRCDGTTCPALVRSDDGGRHWEQVHTFPGADGSSEQGGERPSIGPQAGITRISFASARVGYLTGGDLWATRDAGRTFTRVLHPGASVLDVAVVGHRAYALTAAGCVQGRCTGELAVSEIRWNGAPALSPPLARASLPAEIGDATLSVSGGQLLVLTQAPAGEPLGTPMWRFTGSELVASDPRPTCTGSANVAATSVVAAAGAARGHVMFALCTMPTSQRRTGGSVTQYTTVTSKDGGATWRRLGSNNFSLPMQGHTTMATTDGRHIVVASGGPRTSFDGTTRKDPGPAAAYSDDGGVTWMPLGGGLEKAPDGGFDSVVALDSRTTAVVARTDGTYWSSASPTSSWRHTHLSDGDG